MRVWRFALEPMGRSNTSRHNYASRDNVIGRSGEYALTAHRASNGEAASFIWRIDRIVGERYAAPNKKGGSTCITYQLFTPGPSP